MASFTVTVATSQVNVVDTDYPLAAQALAHACGADMGWVVRLVEVGILEPSDQAAPVEGWRFYSEHLKSALEVRRLERDFDVGLDAAALILDLQREVRRLKAFLGAQGLGTSPN